MVTFKAVVLSHQRHIDDSYNVKIRITHKRKSKYIPTSITAYRTDLTRDLEIRRNTPLMFKCNREIEALTKIVSDMGYLTLENMDVGEVVEYIKQKNKEKEFHLDFFAFAEEWLKDKSKGNRHVYDTALNALERYLGRRELDINSITSMMMRGFADWYAKQPRYYYGRFSKEVKKSKKKKDGTNMVRSVMAYLNTIHSAAKDIYNDDDLGIIRIPRSPFKKIRIDEVARKGQDSLTREEMQVVIDAAKTLDSQQVALDVFVLSFALMGMNVADLYEAAMPKGDELRYYRKKTRDRRLDRAEMRVLIPDCVKDRVERLSDGEYIIGETIKGSNGYYFSSKLSHCMSSMSEGIVGRTFSMYAARKTFATLARNECGVDKATVDECLVHVTRDMKLADVYIKRDWKRLWDVQKKVLDLFEW